MLPVMVHKFEVKLLKMVDFLTICKNPPSSLHHPQLAKITLGSSHYTESIICVQKHLVLTLLTKTKPMFILPTHAHFIF